MKAALRACRWLWLLAWLSTAAAHEARPVALSIHEREGGLYAYELHIPASVQPDNRPTAEWPADCRTVGAQLLRCAQPLAGRSVRWQWPLYNPSVTVLARYAPREGAARTAVLTPGTDVWVIPADPTALGVMRSYFVLGVEHILGGADHLLFVAGLLLIARGVRRLVLAITGFTLAHSVTLSLAALGFVHVPIPPTEAAIALSILFLAREALLPADHSLVHRWPMLVSTTFGLLHGLGFAAALGEVGLPDREIVWALAFFNVGVEAGQLAFILVVVTGAALLARAVVMLHADLRRWRMYGRASAAYLIGIPAAFWLLQRLPH
jgi:hydrogenase/urease accessory protein HupE